MSWLFYAFAATAIYTVQSLLQRSTAVESKNPRLTAFIFNSFAVLITALIVLINGSYRAALPTDPKAWIVVGIGAVFYGLYERGRFKAAKLLEVSMFSTILNLGILIAFVGGVFLYDEPLTFKTLSGALLIIASLFLVSYQKRHKVVPVKSIIFGILISASLGIGFLVDKAGATYFNSDIYGLLVWFFPLALIAYPSIKLKDLQKEPKKMWRETFILASLNAVAYVAMLEALKLSDATKVIPIIQTSILFATLLGIVILKERTRIPEKIIAGILGVIGVYLLV